MSSIELRTIKEAEYIILTKHTIRQTAKKFNISKSTVHNDLKFRLPKIDKNLHLKVQSILQEHFEEKHIKGGQATKHKFEIKKSCKKCVNS